SSDCMAVDQQYISVTPLRIDITQYDFLGELEQWNLGNLLKNNSGDTAKMKVKKKKTLKK
ncbi:MAG: hypothetical protein WCK43_08890, partial [bacterium]